MDGMVRRSILVLVGTQTGDALACAIPLPIIERDLDRLGVPQQVRPVIPVVKALSAVGLAAGLKRPRLGALASAGMLVYFGLALGAHARLRDEPWRYGAAVAMLGWSFTAWRTFRAELTAPSA